MSTIISIHFAGEAGTIIYISRGLMNIITEAQDVIGIISRANLQHDGQVIIHTYGLIDGNSGKKAMQLLSIIF